MISTSFSCERIGTNAKSNHQQRPREPLNDTPMRNSAEFCTGKIQSLRTRSYPESPRHKASLMKLSSQNSSSLTSLLQEKAKTRVGLRNPPHIIYRALQEHKLKMANVLNDTQNSNQAEHLQQLRQQLHSIEEELKRMLAEDQEQFQSDRASAAEEGPQRVAPRRRNSIGRCTNIAHEIESIRHALSYDYTPQQQQQEHQQRQQRRRRNRKHTFPVPLSIPEGEEEHCLWSSCPSLEYEPEPRDLPPKLPTRR